MKTAWFGIAVVLTIMGVSGSPAEGGEKPWFEESPELWPRITLVNQITYTDKHHPIAGSSFLVAVDGDTLAVTAKHILIFFKSETMKGVDFDGTLKKWIAFPKDRPDEIVEFDRLINRDVKESIQKVPSARDWLLFTVRERSPNIQVLEFRDTPLIPGETIYIIGWRYTEKDCPQIIHQGTYLESGEGTVLVSAETLADNTIPGLSGSPVVDARGRVVGLMSTKAGKNQRLASLDYPRRVLDRRKKAAASR